MGLVGPTKQQIEKDRPSLISKGVYVVCVNPSKTLTKGNKYRVQGHFVYLNRKQFDGDHWFEYDQFITIKNDDGWTVKVNLISFKLLSEIEDKKLKIEKYYSDPLNVLQEAMQGEQDEYIAQLERESRNFGGL